MVACSLERQWYIYIAASLVTFIGGILLILPCRVVWYLMYRNPDSKRRESVAVCSRIRAQFTSLLSGQSSFSRILKIVMWLINMASVILYLYVAHRFSREDCGRMVDDPAEYVRTVFCIIFLIHYIIRFLAAPDKTFFWLDIYSIVDHFTIVPCFVSWILDSNWLALRYLRLLYLLQLPDVLELMFILKSRHAIRIAQVASIFIAIWFCSSGFVHICENNGDPTSDYSNSQYLTYWSCVYWLLVTMSTVGFGEISPSTDIGRAFIVLFIIGSFAMFTSFIPELVQSVGHSNKYSKPYRMVYGKKHIVVCGHFSFEGVCSFIKNFAHEDAEARNTNIVFIGSEKPKLEMNAFFKRHFNEVTFVQGTVMDIKILRLVKMEMADAAIILSKSKAGDPDEEDGINIMRATAIKNYCSSMRIIIQIHNYANKAYLLNIPSWNWTKGESDEVICVNELKMGIMAQNCNAPGIAPLLSNLFTNRSSGVSVKDELDQRAGTDYLSLYKYGCGFEIYAEPLSSDFNGLMFKDCALICYQKLGVVLMAVDIRHHGLKSMKRVNLAVIPIDTVITDGSTGFVIAQSPEIARRISYYTAATSTEDWKKKHKLAKQNGGVEKEVSVEEQVVYEIEDSVVGSRLAQYENGSISPTNGLEASYDSIDDDDVFDNTEMMYWCRPQTFEDCIVERGSLKLLALKEHVIVCLLANEDSAQLGLMNFIMPLRGSNLSKDQLKDIVLLGNKEYFRKQWPAISTFPNIYIFEGSAQNRTDLRALNVTESSMCVILSANKNLEVDSHQIDKDTILATLSLKGMLGANVEQRIKSIGGHINTEQFHKHVVRLDGIPHIADLHVDSNVTFIELEDDDNPNTPLYLTFPYMSGEIFASSALESLMSCTYLKGQILVLIRALITGGEMSEFDQILAEGLGIVRKNKNSSSSPFRDRPRLAQFSMACEPLESLGAQTYGELVVKAMQELGFLCLGLYRMINSEIKDKTIKWRFRRKRVTLTNPPPGLELLDSDRVFVLMPPDWNKNRTIQDKPGVSSKDTQSTGELNVEFTVDVGETSTDDIRDQMESQKL